MSTKLNRPAEGIFGAYTRIETTVGPALLVEKGKTRIMITRDEMGPMITEMIQMARELGVTKNQNDK